MGLLDQALGGVLGGALGGGQPTGRGRSPIVNAILLALAAKALQHYLSQRRSAQGGAAGAAPPSQTAPSGGLGDVLGGLLNGGGAGGLGGLLGSLGGAGGLGGLLDQFGRRGLADQSQSWVGTGANQPIEAHHVAEALDDHDVEELATATGLPKAQVLDEVAKSLPEAINALTPNGRLPTDAELAGLSSSYEAQARAAT
jgi:uncharacterized protein YidB (DUF937 family)